MKTVENIAMEAIKAHVFDVKITWVSNYRYLIAKGSAGTPVVGHPRDHAPIMWQIGARGTNTMENFVIDTIKYEKE